MVAAVVGAGVGEGRIDSLGWDLGRSAEGRAGKRDSLGWEDRDTAVEELGNPGADSLVVVDMDSERAWVAGMDLGCVREAVVAGIPGLDMAELAVGKGSQVDFLLLLLPVEVGRVAAVAVRTEREGIGRGVVDRRMDIVGTCFLNSEQSCAIENEIRSPGK